MLQPHIVSCPLTQSRQSRRRAGARTPPAHRRVAAKWKGEVNGHTGAGAVLSGSRRRLPAGLACPLSQLQAPAGPAIRPPSRKWHSANHSRTPTQPCCSPLACCERSPHLKALAGQSGVVKDIKAVPQPALLLLLLLFIRILLRGIAPVVVAIPKAPRALLAAAGIVCWPGGKGQSGDADQSGRRAGQPASLPAMCRGSGAHPKTPRPHHQPRPPYHLPPRRCRLVILPPPLWRACDLPWPWRPQAWPLQAGLWGMGRPAAAHRLRLQMCAGGGLLDWMTVGQAAAAATRIPTNRPHLAPAPRPPPRAPRAQQAQRRSQPRGSWCVRRCMQADVGCR